MQDKMPLGAAAARSAVSIGLPLALGLLTGHRLDGMLIGLGALWAVSQDGLDPAVSRLPRILAIAVTSGLGILIGALVLRGGGTGWPVWLALLAVGAVAGAFEVGGKTAGAASLHLLLGAIVASGLPLPGPVWLGAVLVLGGALWHAALALACEPRLRARVVALRRAWPPVRATHTAHGDARAVAAVRARFRASRATRADARHVVTSAVSATDRLRAAAMTGLLVAGGSVLAGALQEHRTYWLPLAVAFIFRPTTGPVGRRALARTAGTATGALIAAGLAAVAPGDWPAVALAAVCGAAMPIAARRGYGPMCAVFTPIVFTFLDMADDNHGLFATRALDTAIAGALVIAADVALRSALGPGEWSFSVSMRRKMTIDGRDPVPARHLR